MEETRRQTGETWTLFGSIGAAVGAAVCCLGPVILVSVGVSGAWIGQLSALEPYRPLFMAVAGGFLTFGFYRAYWTSASRTDAGGKSCAEDCEVPRAQRINRGALWVATLIVSALFASPYLLAAGAPGISASPEAGAEEPTEAVESGVAAASAETETERVELNVEGMTCAGCVRSLTSKLEELKGVESADVTLEPPRATVEYAPEYLEPSDLTEKTKSIGYPSTIVD